MASLGTVDEEAASTAPALDGGGCAFAAASKRPAMEAEKSTHVPKRQKRAEYSEETRALCVRRHQTEGVSYATISKELGIPHDSVRAIVRKAKRTGSVSSAPRSGRPRKTSGIVDRVILEAVRANKQCSAKSIQQDLLRLFGVKVSPETVRRRVLEHTKQRIQSLSGGTSSDPPTALGNAVAADSSAAIARASTAIDTSLSGSLSFQQMLHQGNQSTPDAQALGSSGSTTSQATEETLAASGVPSPAPATGTGMDPEAFLQHDEPSSQKRPKRGEYSIETREQCVALHDQGQGYRRIGKALDMPHTTVRAIVEKAQRTGSVLPAKRSGRPRKTDEIVDKVILQAVQANEKSSARLIKEQLLNAYGVRVSCETIRRRVKEHSRQCMVTSASGATSATLSSSEVDATLAQQQAAHEQDMMALAAPPPMAAASLITFDEDGVHL
jgi:transposase